MPVTIRRIYPILLALCLALTLAGCATTAANLPPEVPAMHTVAEIDDERVAYVDDPWEGFNRSIYKFNYNFDKYFFIPVVNSYEFITPTIVQTSVSNFFSNLGEIRNLTNSIFQLKGMESLTTLGRFVTNSTIGLGGLFDPATRLGLERHIEDFGQTLGYWGVGSGNYLVLPILGPSSVRDTGGYAVDSAIYYGIYYSIDPFKNVNHGTAIEAGITTLTFIDLRHKVKFRYYESGYPFEYYMVRFLYHEKRELEAKK